jgi:RNA polymerase sigma-B factor
MSFPVTSAPRNAHHDQRLFERYRSERDPATREALLERFLPLARHLARRYRAGGEAEDLAQVASLGLLKAIDRFDPARGIAFTSFAVPTIMGELKRYFRDHGWTVRVPRELQELAARLDAVTDELTARLRRAPTAGELATRCGASVEQVLEALATPTAHHPVSLDRPRDADGEPAEGPGAEDPVLAGIEDDDAFEARLAVLSERARIVMRLRFRHELRQREIGERLGVSQMQISRLIARSLTTLNHDEPARATAT